MSSSSPWFPVLVPSRDWCLAQWLILSTSVVRTWGRIPLGKFLAAKLNIQYPVKSLAPYLGGRRGRVPSDSLRKFLQEVNLYNSFNIFFFFVLVPSLDHVSSSSLHGSPECLIILLLSLVARRYSFCTCSMFIVRFSGCSLPSKPCCRDLAQHPVFPRNFVCIVII